MARVLVTGATGFLGQHLVEELLGAGEEVTALVRGRTLAAGVPETWRDRVRLLRGELDELSERDLEGCVRLYHVAALYSEDPADRDRLHAVNGTATEELLRRAARAGVARCVHVSTIGTIVPSARGGVATEEDSVDPERASAYALSKLRGEEAALATEGTEVVVANPGALVGRGDRGPGVTGARLLAILRGERPHLPRGPMPYLPVRCCARALRRCAERGVPSRRYLLGGENLGPAVLLARVRRAAGLPPLRGGPPWDRLRERLRPAVSFAVDDSRARTELDWTPRPVDEAFAEAADDFRRRGLLS